jgi:ABC-type arginine/histidine transport system permease subunit
VQHRRSGSSASCAARAALTFRVLPLAFRISLPALNNNLVTLVKGTTVAYAIGVPELMTASSAVAELTHSCLIASRMWHKRVTKALDPTAWRLNCEGHSASGMCT